MNLGNRPRQTWVACAGLCVATLLLSGCAAVTKPLANGVPVRLVPDELLVEPKERLVPIPLTWLRRKPPETYRLDEGDILGIYIEGVLGQEEQIPPVYFPETANQAPSFGFPIPVGEGGYINLPLIPPLKVVGLTEKELEAAIVKAYTQDRKVLVADEQRILVSLIRPRQARILVVREDNPNSQSNFVPGYGVAIGQSAVTAIQNRDRGSGAVVEMPATESDVLGVLTRTGGLPGPNAANEVIVLRGYHDVADAGTAAAVAGDFLTRLENISQPDQGATAGGSSASAADDAPRAIRIPLRWPPHLPPPFRAEDVALQTGDIVLIPALDAQVYYTGGILPPREVPLPRDYDISVVEAVLRVGGPVLSGGINTGNFNGALVGGGLGGPSPSLLSVVRKTEDGGQLVIRVDLNRAMKDSRENILVKPGDILVLQETPSEAFARYSSQAFGFGVLTDVFRRGSATGTASLQVP